MSKDKDLVEKISRLSRLKIDENEIEGFIKNFKDILNYIDLLTSVKIVEDSKDIEIYNDLKGKPYYFKSKKIIDTIYKNFKTRKFDIFLSISDEKDHSIAFTILYKKI